MAGEGEIKRRPAGGNGNQNARGVLSFYTDEATGFQIGPTTVLASSLMFIGLVVVLHILGKFSS